MILFFFFYLLGGFSNGFYAMGEQKLISPGGVLFDRWRIWRSWPRSCGWIFRAWEWEDERGGKVWEKGSWSFPRG